ncbi:MAG TPA: hypothetical protein VLL73_00570, partial [Desulfurivibrionaceae bacterium]|nr:hypothetical protein [Desulfurivibrionaceae bacterium]
MVDKGVCEAMEGLASHKSIFRVSSGNPVICGECAQRGPTCCRCDVAEAELIAPLSTTEWEQIRAQVPWAANGPFVVKERNTLRFIREMQRLFPDNPTAVEATFPLGATHLRLAQNATGQCVFLGPHGCLLPNAARPLFCQIYPFWIIYDEIFALGDPHCLALQALDSTATALAAL